VLCRADSLLQAGGSSGVFVLILRVVLGFFFSASTLAVYFCSLLYTWVLLPRFALCGLSLPCHHKELISVVLVPHAIAQAQVA